MSTKLTNMPEYLAFSSIFLTFVFEKKALFRGQLVVDVLELRWKVVKTYKDVENGSLDGWIL